MASSHVCRPRIHWAVAVSENLLVVAVWVNLFWVTCAQHFLLRFVFLTTIALPDISCTYWLQWIFRYSWPHTLNGELVKPNDFSLNAPLKVGWTQGTHWSQTYHSPICVRFWTRAFSSVTHAWSPAVRNQILIDMQVVFELSCCFSLAEWHLEPSSKALEHKWHMRQIVIQKKHAGWQAGRLQEGKSGNILIWNAPGGFKRTQTHTKQTQKTQKRITKTRNSPGPSQTIRTALSIVGWRYCAGRQRVGIEALAPASISVYVSFESQLNIYVD